MVTYTDTIDHSGGTDTLSQDIANLRLSHPRPWCGAGGAAGRGSEADANSKVYNYGAREDKEKTPMCRIAELCRFHKIKHEYKLMDESGPAHKKMFTVQLVLSANEKYEGVGGSIKKAQQNAAAVALTECTREMPPSRNDRARKKAAAASSPPVLLRHATQRLGLPEPVYTRADFAPPPPAPFVSPPHNISFQPNRRPVPFGNQINNGHAAVPNEIHATSPPLLPSTPAHFFPQPLRMPSLRAIPITLFIGVAHPIFRATAPSVQQGRDSCAVQALVYLGPLLAHLDQQIKERQTRERTNSGDADDAAAEKENKEDDTGSEDTDNSGGKQKSVVSRLHECALQLKLIVAFETLAEEGPAHSRHYVVRCCLSGGSYSLTAEGEGKNKKAAKQMACRAILDKVHNVEQSPLYIAQSLYKYDKRGSQGKEHKRKTIVKDKKMDPDYGHQINPVSRLMQVVQTRAETEPRFEVIKEHGLSRYKEFVVEVTWNGTCCEGSGPNKRLAKRAAAEAMLAQIGYVKPMPPPGKSLLKRRSEDMPMSIGVFDPEEALKASEPVTEEKETDEMKDDSNQWGAISIETPVERAESEESSEASPLGEPHLSPNGKRRVTFSNQVCACPPPDDSTYPMPQIAPLKSEVVVVGKLRRKGRDGKRVLSPEQARELVWRAQQFLDAFCEKNKLAMVPAKGGDPQNDPTVSAVQMVSARRRLEALSDQFKFTAQYCNFQSPGSDFFVLVTLGLEKPIVANGNGTTPDDAADNAAFNALKSLAQLEVP